jgi:hypothetical protein
MHWFRAISADPNDLSPVADALVYFQDEYEAARKELMVKGRRIDETASRIPGILEWRFAQYQELETILSYLERVEAKAVVEKTQWYMASYNRQINELTARKYAEVHDDVFPLTKIKLEVATCRNNFLAIFKAIECLHYQIGNVTKLRAAGLDDATF